MNATSLEDARTQVQPAPPIRSLQILRFVAAVSVVYYHTHHAPQFGGVGVDIFFVLSGFVIAMLLRSDRYSAARFLLDRITRVGPLYWAITLFLLGLVLAYPSLFNSTEARPTHVLGSLLFVPTRDAYGELLPLLRVGWTLNYEVLFYCLAAFCLLRKKRTAWLAATMAAVFVAGTLASPTEVWGEFLSNSRFLEFGLGIFGFELSRRFPLPNFAASWTLVAAGLVCLFLVEFNRPGAVPLFGFGLPALVVLLGMLGVERGLPDNVCTRSMVLLGDSSYALYLTHTFVLAFLDRKLSAWLPALRIDTLLGSGIAVAVSCAVSVGVYLLVDKPLVRLARSVVRPRAVELLHR